jgi:hypothetical protein
VKPASDSNDDTITEVKKKNRNGAAKDGRGQQVKTDSVDLFFFFYSFRGKLSWARECASVDAGVYADARVCV